MLKFLRHIYFLSYSVLFVFGKKSAGVWAQDWVFILLLCYRFPVCSPLHFSVPVWEWFLWGFTVTQITQSSWLPVLPKLLKGRTHKKMHHWKARVIKKNHTKNNKKVLYSEESDNSLLMSCHWNSNSLWSIFLDDRYAEPAVPIKDTLTNDTSFYLLHNFH